MSNAPNTIFLRLEGPLQAWGDNSKFVIRPTMEAPTKSGVLGLICCAMGCSRRDAPALLNELKGLRMGVRIDRSGTRWWDYHTVGAGYGVLTAKGDVKITPSTKTIETLVTRREYLCDASFLVALQGDVDLVQRLRDALMNPRWSLYLGRKCCPPSTPIVLGNGNCGNVRQALESLPWQPRLKEIDGEPPRHGLACLIEWRPSADEPISPTDAEVWYDAPVSFDPPVHEARLVQRTTISVGSAAPTQLHTLLAPRPQAAYGNREYRNRSAERRKYDQHLCVFCKAPLTPKTGTVHHITYRHAGGDETIEELRSLCRLCHDAVTMIEYGLNMGINRINPQESRWRELIIEKRQEIIAFRSLETRRRHLSPEEVE